jgi:MFS family permease
MIHSSTNLAVALDEPSVFRRMLGVLAPVKRDEIVTVVILTVNVFVLLTCYYVLKVLREPMILLGGGAELKAYASAGQTLLLLGVVPAFSWLSSRVDRVRLLTTMQLIFIGCLIGFYALAHAEAPIGLAFYLWLGIFNILVVSNFWSFANDLYNEEQGCSRSSGSARASARSSARSCPSCCTACSACTSSCWSPRAAWRCRSRCTGSPIAGSGCAVAGRTPAAARPRRRRPASPR